ncbi:MAG: hypothetical protein Q7W05_09630, partial [Deltaproteobacteria bacterium]|nr:hypothetical protein [Deltaproteobacteria bacterium]
MKRTVKKKAPTVVKKTLRPKPAIKKAAKPVKKKTPAKKPAIKAAAQPKKQDLFTTLKEWNNTCVQPMLAKYPERKKQFLSTSGDEVKRVYTPCETDGLDYQKDLGFPGQYPYTRGVQPT